MKKIFRLIFLLVIMLGITGCGKAKIIEIDVKSIESISVYDGTSQNGYSFSYVSGESSVFYEEWKGISKKSYEFFIDDDFDNKLLEILNKYKYSLEDSQLEGNKDDLSGDSKYLLMYVNGYDEGYYVSDSEKDDVISDIIELINLYEKQEIIDNF